MRLQNLLPAVPPLSLASSRVMIPFQGVDGVRGKEVETGLERLDFATVCKGPRADPCNVH